MSDRSIPTLFQAIRGFRRWTVSLFTCGPSWTLRHLRVFGGLK